MDTNKGLIGICLVGLVIMLSGCGGKESAEERQETNHFSAAEQTSYEIVEETEQAWKDNSLDELQAVINVPIPEVKEAGEQVGGALQYFVSENGAARFKNHLIGTAKKNWSGISGISTQGVEYSKLITADPNREGMQVYLIGSVAGTAESIAYWDERNEEDEIIGQWFYGLNEDYEVIWTVQAEEPYAVPLTAIAGDNKGNIHMLLNEENSGNTVYCVLSRDGKKIFEETYSGSCRILCLSDGRVVICENLANEGRMEGMHFLEPNLNSKTQGELANLKIQTIITETMAKEIMPFFATMDGKGQLVWCGKEGVYLCDGQGESTRMVYRWQNHGLTVREVKHVYAMSDGRIGIIYKDNAKVYYLLLKPTEEKTEIQTIVFATPEMNKPLYAEAVAEFNKRYPDYCILLKEDYEQTSLLTQLGAGRGPVLVDTALTGFEELEKLWQPLDGYIRDVGLEEELLPQALDFGKIEGRTYGIVTHFFIRALAVRAEQPKDWNYNEFLEAVEKFDGPVFSYEYASNGDQRKYYFDTFCNGLDDNIYVDKDTGTFESGEFNRVLQLAEKAKPCPPAEEGRAVSEGKALCEIVNVFGAEGLVKLRARSEKGDVFIGYPTKNGARYLLCAKTPITVRTTATDEEKRIAYTFLKILLSHESARESVRGNVNSLYSVRKDILEEQFKYYEKAYGYSLQYKNLDEMLPLNREKELEWFQRLLDHSIVQKSFPVRLQNIYEEEIGRYLSGEITSDMLKKNLKSRMELYLDEN